jgi:opacity protein-like surface antigen
MKPILLALALALSLIGKAAAQQGPQAGLYLKGTLGVVVADDWDRIVGNVQNFLGAAATGSEESDLGLAAAIGYRYSRRFAVELAYMDAGERSVDFASVPASFRSSAKHASVSALAIAPVTERLEVYGRLGFAHWNLDSNFVPGGVGIPPNQISGNDLLFGGGLAYALTRQLDLTGEYLRLKMKVAGGYLSLDHYLYGLRFRFD